MFLFIESQDPFEDKGAGDYLGFALELARQRESVTVFFIENGVHATRKGAELPVRDALREAGATLKVDDFSARERGISPERLSPGLSFAGVDQVIDLLADPSTRAIWH